MNGAEAEDDNRHEKRLLKSFVAFAQALQTIPYLNEEPSFVAAYNSLVRLIQTKCGARYTKTAQFLQSHLQDLNNLNICNPSIRTHVMPVVARGDAARSSAAAAQAPVRSSVEAASPPKSTASTPRAEDALLPDAEDRPVGMTPPKQPKSGSPRSPGSTTDQLVADMLRSNSVSLWLAPQYSFCSFDARTKLLGPTDFAPAFVPIGPGPPVWKDGADVHGHFATGLAEKLPASLLRELQEPRAAPPPPVSGKKRRESPAAGKQQQTQRTKRRKQDTAGERQAAARALAISRQNSPPSRAATSRRRNSAEQARFIVAASTSQEDTSLNSDSESVSELPPDEELYNVELIVDMRKDQVGQEWFLIKWEGYAESDNSWEPPQNLESFGDHSARLRYLRAWYQARMRVSRKLDRDPNYKWEPVTMQDKQFEQEMRLFIERELASSKKFYIEAAKFQTPGTGGG